MGFLKLFSHGLIKFCVRLILHSTGYLLFPFYWKPFWNVNVVFILSNWNDIDHFQTHSIVPESYCAIFSYLCWCTAQVPCDYKQIFLFVKAGWYDEIFLLTVSFQHLIRVYSCQMWMKFFNLQSWKYFRRKNFYQIFDKNFFWNTFHESKIKSLLKMT